MRSKTKQFIIIVLGAGICIFSLSSLAYKRGKQAGINEVLEMRGGFSSAAHLEAYGSIYNAIHDDIDKDSNKTLRNIGLDSYNEFRKHYESSELSSPKYKGLVLNQVNRPTWLDAELKKSEQVVAPDGE